jgi:2'-5' RNA ligase
MNTAALPRVPAAFWLLPCEADAARLQAMVHALATMHAAPTFEPHLTLHVVDCPAATEIEHLLAGLAERHPVLALAALATGHSDAYYKTLYVDVSCELQDGPGLVALRRDLVEELAATGQAAGYDFHPHVSLLYGQLPAPQRADLAANHDLHGHTLRFDRIAAVRPRPGHHDLSRVSHWEVYGHRRLRD